MTHNANDVEHRPTYGRNGSDGTYAVGCTCGAATCDSEGWREHYDRVTPTAKCGCPDDECHDAAAPGCYFGEATS